MLSLLQLIDCLIYVELFFSVLDINRIINRWIKAYIISKLNMLVLVILYSLIVYTIYNIWYVQICVLCFVKTTTRPCSLGERRRSNITSFLCLLKSEGDAGVRA